MAEKVTRERVAKASKVLQDRRVGKDSKSAAGSALSQRGPKASRRMTLREAYDVTVALYGDVLKELAKH